MSSERVVLTKSQLSTEAGAGLVRLCLQVGLDGDFSNDDLQLISNYVNACDDSVPAVRHLKAILADALADGVIADTERALLHRQIERVLPPTERTRLKMAREGNISETIDLRARQFAGAAPNDHPSEAQVRYIKALGGKSDQDLTREEASEYIDRLLHSNTSITPRQWMVLRFWNVEPQKTWGRSQVSEWMDTWYQEDPSRLEAWEMFKESTGDTGSAKNPESVPRGCGHEWIKRCKQSTFRSPPVIARPQTSVKETKSIRGTFLLAVLITTALLLFFASRPR